MIVNVKKGDRVLYSNTVSDENTYTRKKRKRNYNYDECKVQAIVTKGGRSFNDITHVQDEVEAKRPVIERDIARKERDPKYQTESKFMQAPEKIEEREMKVEVKTSTLNRVEPKIKPDIKEEESYSEKISDRAEALGIDPEKLAEAMATDFNEDLQVSENIEKVEEEEVIIEEHEEKNKYEEYRNDDIEPVVKIQKKIDKSNW